MTREDRYSARLDRHDELITKLLEQQIRTEEHIQQLVNSDAKDHKAIESVTARQYDSEKILSAMGVRLSVIQWIGVTVGSGIIVSVIGYLVLQLLK